MESQKTVRISLGLKASVAIVFIAAVLSTVAIIFSYLTYKQALENQLIQSAFSLAQTMAAEIDPESIDRYLKSGVVDDSYRETRQHLINIQKSNDIVYAVVTKPTEDGFYYVFDTDQSDDAFALGDFQEFYPGDFLDNKENFLSGNVIKPIITDYEFGWLISALVPIKDGNGILCGYVNVDLSMTAIKNMEQKFLVKLACILAMLTLLMVILLLAGTRKKLITPINRLASAASDFVRRQEQADSVREVLELPGLDTEDELGHLYRSIRKMESDIYTYIDDLTSVTAEKERIGAELDVAKHIQASMLPSIFPAFPERPELDIYATMTPAKEVGGDFYDFFLIDDDHLAMVMADVSGKGVPAALFMVITKTLVKNVAQAGLSPKSVLEKVNKQLCVGNDAEMFVTVWLGILEISTGKVICSNSGHEYPVIKRANCDYELLKDKHGFVLAGMERSRYTEYELLLQPGDRIFLYTDGVPEATNASNKLYGTDRMMDTLNRNKECDCKQLLSAIKEDVDVFVGQAPQFDDITMLCLTLMPTDTFGMQKLKLPPSLEAMTEVTAFVEQRMEDAGLPMKLIAQMNIAVDEIFSNIACYSGATDVTVGVKISNGCLTLRFADNGLSYDPTATAVPDTTLPAEEREIGGLGLLMVRKFMDTVEYDYHDGLNILTLEKRTD
ncbi:MAG: SpoIIE family protein phosphatase [Clostridium sp.]